MFKFKYRAEKSPKAWLFLSPALALIGVFSVYPIIQAIYWSFQKGSLYAPKFNGLTNYITVLNDPKFHDAVANTALFAFVVVPVGLIISIFIAVTINEKIKHKSLFESLFFLPYLTSVVAVGIVFRFLFNHNYGVINYLLSFINIAPINFLDNTSMSMITLIIFGIWSSLAFNIIIISSGINSIDKNYYKLADMFGASRFEQFIKITLPQLIPILTFLVTINLISAFKVYTQVYSLFNGKPGIAESATTGVFYIFTKFYVDAKYGQGMAAAIILFMIILIITIIQKYITKRITK